MTRPAARRAFVDGPVINVAALLVPPAPLTPAGYLRLCRAASGRSIEQIAERIEPLIRRRGDVATMLRLLEIDGAKARDIQPLRLLTAALPTFDADVYGQLRDTPPDRHPTICRGCGRNPRSPRIRRRIGRSTGFACTLCAPEGSPR